ncbi:hypothetical protein GTO91_16465 [Heliobacterium undosum]|uniref:Uncharacterized protein n=1 Tax=Heliomicrobium undosum TaxID=121734 RepID=A0A845L3U3_9FIRM|nr:hypothetical protein [Heliomicrobium undosum]MZP31302.1 hypothetical protein [Heliomicrobium undosum]
MQDAEEYNLHVRLSGQEMDEHKVSLDVLTRVLTGLQQICYLLATDHHQHSFQQRFRVPSAIQRQYLLRCALPQSGSYVVPLSLTPPEQGTILTDDLMTVLAKMNSFFRSLSSGSDEMMATVTQDKAIRNRLLRESKRLLPKADERWVFGIQFASNPTEHRLDYLSSRFIDSLLSAHNTEDQLLTVTGELIRIDFEQRRAVIKYPPTHREIECIYREELEDTMIDSRRQMIQVTGQFTLNNDGHPLRLTEVTKIETLDLSDVVLTTVPSSRRVLKFKQPIVITPYLDSDSQQLLVLEEPSLGIHVFGYTRDQVIQELYEQVQFLWDEYAKAPESNLAPDAQQLRQWLLFMIEELEGGS